MELQAASPDEAPKPDTIANEAGEPHVTTEDPTKEGASQEAEPATSAADDLPSLDDPVRQPLWHRSLVRKV